MKTAFSSSEITVTDASIAAAAAAVENDAAAGGTAADEMQPEVAAYAARLERALPALNRRLFMTNHPLADLPVAQLRLCSLLLGEGRRTMSQIGDELGISVSAVTQMADRLEKAGMVERVAEPGGDRRTRHLQLTQNGYTLMRSRRDTRTRRAGEVLGRLSTEQREMVMQALNLLLDAARESNPDPLNLRSGDAPWAHDA